MCQSSRSLSFCTPNSSHQLVYNPIFYDDKRNPDLKSQALVQDLSWRLCFGDVPAKIQAARDVRKIARASSKARSAFAVASVVQPLLTMLGDSQLGEVKEAGVLAILNIAARNERNKVSIVKFGAVPPLVELLRCQSSRLRDLATAAILTLSSSDSNKSTIITSGAAKLLVQILISGSIQGRVDAVTALYNLSSCKDSPEPSVCVDSVFPLLNLLRDSKKFSKFAEKATSLLEILSYSEEGRAAIAGLDGGILALVETVEDGSLLSAEYAASTLLSLCRSCREKYRELILNEGAIPGILLLTVNGTERAQKIARTLLELLRDDSKRKRVTSEALQNIVYDIASRVDGPDKASETAGKLLKDMTRNMELSRIEQN